MTENNTLQIEELEERLVVELDTRDEFGFCAINWD